MADISEMQKRFDALPRKVDLSRTPTGPEATQAIRDRILYAANDLNNNSDWCYYLSTFCECVDLPRPYVQIALKELRNDGLVEYVRGLFTEDMMTAGSGWRITPKGITLAEQLFRRAD
jgi:hypothetical protein